MIQFTDSEIDFIHNCVATRLSEANNVLVMNKEAVPIWVRASYESVKMNCEKLLEKIDSLKSSQDM